MLSRVLLRLAVSAVAAAGLCATVIIAQSQDSQSVSDAARRAREQKKAAAKPTKVITEDEIKPAKSSESEAAQTPASWTAGGAATTQAPAGDATATPAKNEKNAKELGALKEQIKQAQSDLDLIKRDQALQQDTYYSNPDYTHDTAGKAKLDGMKQQISDKQEELDKLKARLAELGATLDNPPTTPAKP